jgi:hypothetical protein
MQDKKKKHMVVVFLYQPLYVERPPQNKEYKYINANEFHVACFAYTAMIYMK